MITSIWMKPGDDLKTALDIREQVFQQELGFTRKRIRTHWTPIPIIWCCC